MLRCMLQRTSSPAAARSTAALSHALLVAAPRRPSRACSTRTMAFLSSRHEALCGMARRWVQTWGGAAAKGMVAAKKELGDMVAEDAVFQGDGLVYRHDTQGRDAILAALEHAHHTNEHVTNMPVAVAADDAAGLAFVGVAWEFRSQASGRSSRGFSIKQLHFNEAGQLTRSRVNRQLTADEREPGQLLAPGVECQPADVFADLLPLLGQGAQDASAKPVPDSKAAARKMASNLERWVACWSSDTPNVEQTLQQVLSPGLIAYDGYGLHAGKKRGSAKEAAVSMAGVEGAAAAIEGLHGKFRDRNQLLACAVNPDMRLAFDHWRGEASGRDSGASFVVEGVDMLLFDEEGRIARMVQFDMQDYSHMLASTNHDDAAPAGSA